MPRDLTALDQLELEKLNRLPNRTVATIASARFCAEHDLNLPPEMHLEMSTLLARASSDESSSRKGRRANDFASYRQDYIDFIRWDAVTEIREKQQESRQQLAELRQLNGVPVPLLKEKSKSVEWLGRSLVRAFECASMILRRTGAHGGEDAIKRSYYIVKKTDDPSKYLMLDAGTLNALGLGASWHHRARSNKLIPFYDLTP